MIRSALAVLLPAIALAVWAMSMHPAGVGFLGIPVFVVTFLAALVGLAFVRRDDSPEPGRRRAWALVFVAGAAATAYYWYRVWLYRQYEMEGIPLLFFYLFGFWWPGFFVAVASRFLERGFARLRLSSYLARLGVGVLAGAVGAGTYEIVKEEYYEKHDVMPFAEAAAFLPPGAPGLVPGSYALAHDPETKRLTARFEVDPARADSQYELFRALDNYLTTVAGFLDRKDTAVVTVDVTTPEGSLLSLEVTEADSARDPWSLAHISRERLPSGGRLGPGDLAAIVRWTHVDFADPATRESFDQTFDTEIADSTVAITFDLPGPFSAVTADLYAAAWKTANSIVDETLRYFPDVAIYQVRLPGLEREVARAAATEGGFRLQKLLLAEERLLGLLVRQKGRGQGELDPASYYPSGLPLSEAQIAVVRVMDPLEEHVAGALFEEMLVGTGRLYVGEIAPDGTATLVFVGWQGQVQGTGIVAPGEEIRLGEEAVRNLGWHARDRFRQEERAAPVAR